MRRQTKADKFMRTFHYWCGQLKLDENIPFHKDNRYDCPAAVIDYNTKHPKVIYNAKKLARWDISFIIAGVFHEIAHLKYKLPYRTEKERIKAELNAERYALRMLLKHYPKMYKRNNKLMRERINKPYWRRKNELHYKAFSKIKEYQ